MEPDTLKIATCLLYLLMRDVVPTGEIIRVIRMVQESKNDDIVFSSKELETYANKLAQELFS